MPKNVELPHCVDAEQKPANALGRRVGSARVVPDVVYSIHREPVAIGTLARNRERWHVIVGSVRSVGNHARVERHQLQETPPVYWQILDLVLRDETGGR